MSKNRHADASVEEATAQLDKATSTSTQLHESGYNDLDDDWIDMQSSTTFAHNVKEERQDDHLVPSSIEGKTFHESALAESTTSLLSLPSDYIMDLSPSSPGTVQLSLQVPVIDCRLGDQQLVLDDETIPTSATPSTSESEYSLLNPSSDQSRKNSLSGTPGFHALTPTDSRTSTASPSTTDDQFSQSSQRDDVCDNSEENTHYLSSLDITSPSFSDFVQVGSDHGDDFSMSSRQSGNHTPSSDGKARIEEASNSSIQDDDDILETTAATIAAVAVAAVGASDEEEKNGSNRSRGIQEALQDVTSGPGEKASPILPTTETSAFSTPPPSVSTISGASTLDSAFHIVPDLQSTISPANKNRYRTTVEDARSSSEEERGHIGSSSTFGMRYRGAQTQQDDRSDIRNSFFGAASATSTMPGGLNLGLDADISHFSRPTPQEAAVPSNEPPVDERQCRICLGGADEEDTLGRLISPCLCKGSMKYVHIECLNAWRTRSPKRESHYKCDTCKYAFSFRRTSFARYLGHPLTLFVLTILAFALLVFAAGFVMKLLLYLTMDEAQELVYPADLSDEDDLQAMRARDDIVIIKTPETLRAVFQIDKTHMVFGSFFVSIIGFMQLFFSTIYMGGGGGIFRIGGFGLGGGRRRGGRGERQGEAGIGGVVMVVILVFGLFKSIYTTYQFVNKMSRRALAKAESMVLEVQA
ncbi:hypothetical protein FBU30_001963 [Linnemannia zychae]|nr:hypothetical protein FBU30_001963 [Linnemannia zychae]